MAWRWSISMPFLPRTARGCNPRCVPASAPQRPREAMPFPLDGNGARWSPPTVPFRTGLLGEEASRLWIKIARERKRFRQKVVWQP
eukprot:4014317-Prymnesium_polylepis.1